MCLLGQVCLLFCLNSLGREYKCSFLSGFPLFPVPFPVHFPVPLEMGENMWPVLAKDVNASDMCNFWAKRFKSQWATIYAVSKSQTQLINWTSLHMLSPHFFLRSIRGILGTFYGFLYHADICRITLLPSFVPHLDCKSSPIPLHPPHLETSLISFQNLSLDSYDRN